VASYDVSSNPSVVEGESMQSVKKNRRTLVEQWWHILKVLFFEYTKVLFFKLRFPTCCEYISSKFSFSSSPENILKLLKSSLFLYLQEVGKRS
jgi:hypothetical protein